MLNDWRYRFAGLALLPRVCEASADVQYRVLYEAISLSFVWRLLVPLRDPRFIGKVDDVEDVHKQLLGALVAPNAECCSRPTHVVHWYLLFLPVAHVVCNFQSFES